MTLSLYNSPGVNINDLLREAHPEGSANIIDSPSHEGVVEDSIEAQMKAIKMVYKQPVAKVLASLGETLESLGAIDMAESVDNLGYNFYHEAVLIRNPLVSLAEIPLPINYGEGTDIPKPIDFGDAAAPAAGGVAGGAVRSGATALMNVLKSAPGAAMSGAGSFVYGPGAMGVGELAGMGVAGTATVGAAVVAAAGVGVGVGLLINKLGLTKLIAYIQSLFEDSPYSSAIDNIDTNLKKIHDDMPLLQAERLISMSKGDCEAILKTTDVEPNEREAVNALLERIHTFDGWLADATKKFLAQQQANPGKSDTGLLVKQFNDTKAKIDKLQEKASQISAVSENQAQTEQEINKIFSSNLNKIQQFKRSYILVIQSAQNGKELDPSIKTRAVEANNLISQMVDKMSADLDGFMQQEL